jgi:molecular chaperone DnaK (HSP70)
VPKITVKFEIDVNGILQVKATSSNCSKTFVIHNDRSRFTACQLNSMIKDAELTEDDDNRIKLTINSKIKLENYLYELDTRLNSLELKNRLTDSNIRELTDIATQAKQFIGSVQNAAPNTDIYDAKLAEIRNKIEKIDN